MSAPLDTRAFAQALERALRANGDAHNARMVAWAVHECDKAVVDARTDESSDAQREAADLKAIIKARDSALAYAQHEADELRAKLNDKQSYDAMRCGHALAGMRVVARALYPDEPRDETVVLSAEALAQQATRLHELSASAYAENVRLRGELGDAHYALSKAREARARLAKRCDEYRAMADDGDLRAVEPITESAPLRVGDRVRLRDAVVTKAPAGTPATTHVQIDGERDGFDDLAATVIYVGAIAGRVKP